jgi:hypothetical protein
LLIAGLIGNENAAGRTGRSYRRRCKEAVADAEFQISQEENAEVLALPDLEQTKTAGPLTAGGCQAVQHCSNAAVAISTQEFY